MTVSTYIVYMTSAAKWHIYKIGGKNKIITFDTLQSYTHTHTHTHTHTDMTPNAPNIKTLVF